MNKFQWNFNHNTNFFIYENALENIVCEMAAICPGGDELTHCGLMMSMVSDMLVNTLKEIGPLVFIPR